MESYIVRDLVPFGDSFAPAGEIPQRFLVGFSKSGNGVLSLILRNPNVFSAAAAWDAPAQVNDINRFSGLSLNFGTQANFDLYRIPGLVITSAQAFAMRNRLWISGDDSSYTGDMLQLHSQMTDAAVQHSWVQGGFRQHNWGSGWLEGAVTALDANATAAAPVDANEQRIVAYGLRNPRVAFRPGTQELWVADRGWNNWEEIDRIPNATGGAMRNFGWPCYEGSASTGYSSSGICTLLASQTAAAAAPYYAYNHQQPVVTGDEAGVGGGAISGLAFYDSGTYPDEYQGALFFSDYLRNHIWVMFKGAGGLPDPASRATFLLGAASPVDLKTGPGGDLFYADFDGGTIRRITYQVVIRSNGQPSGILPAGTTQTNLSLATDINATCRYATTPGVAYGSMPNTFGTTGATAHSTSITGLVSGGSYSYYVRCQDTTGHANTDDFPITFTVAVAGDTTPPVRSAGQPAGTLAAGTTQATLSLATGENASCRFATAAGVAYGSMSNTFTTTGATAHAVMVTGLAAGGSYNYYVRCQDATGNANTDDFIIAFSISTGGSTATSSFSGIENPLSEGGMWDSPGTASDLRKNNGAYAIDSWGHARLVAPPIAADQYSEITYSQDPGGSSWVGVSTRVQSAANGSCYLAIVTGGGVRLYRVENSGSLSFMQLGTATADIGAAPRRLRLESQGSTHRVYLNGVQVISASEALYTAGQPGIAAAVFGGPTVNILSFEGGYIGAADTTPPVRSNGQPAGALPSGTTQTTLRLTTNESATCRYATAAGVPYMSMANTFTTTGGTAHAATITGLANGVSYNYYARCQDTAANANPDDFTISFSVTPGVDTIPPMRSNGQPTGVLASGAAQVTLSLTTDENAACRYATSAGVAYSAMPDLFTTTGGTAHSTNVTGLAAGSYSYYVRCQDTSSNANPDDLIISFSVAAPGSIVTSSFTGVESPLSEGGMWDSPGSASDLRKNNGAYSIDSWGHARLVTPTVAADQYSEITYSQDPGSSSWVGVTTRVQSATNGSCYLAIAYAGQVRLYRVEDSGGLGFVHLVSASADVAAAPRRLRLESQGSTHRVYLNGVQVLSASESTYTSGQPGIAAAVFGGPTVNIQSFEGGSIGGVDAMPPLRSNGQPAGSLPAGTTQATLSLTTDENATCRFSTTAGVAYASMANTFATTGGTAHASTVTGLVNGGSYSYSVRCQDTAANANPDDFAISFTVAQPADTTPPLRANGLPTGTLPAGTTQATLSLVTNENATCRYATTRVSYASMPNVFTTTGGTAHSTPLTGLVNGGSYIYYVRCQDAAGNANRDDYAISFSVAQGADTTPPVLANGAPSGTLAAGTTSATLNLTTNENATCRYAASAGIGYAAMPNAFAATGGTAHATSVTGLVNGGSYSYYVRCQDAAGNANASDFPIAFTVAQAGDTTPPVRSNGQPAGTLAAGTTQATLALSTGENATCRYATSAGTAYAAMPNLFTTTGGASHTSPVTGLVNGGSYSYYVRCQDGAGNANPDDFVIAFSVSASGSAVTSSFTGIESPLSEGGMWDSPGSASDLRKNNGAYTTDSWGHARLVTPPAGADQYSEITYSQDPGSSSWVGVTTRVQSAANGSCYLAIAFGGGVRLYRVEDSGGLSFTQLASANADIAAAPRRLRLESQGNTHRVYLNGVQVLNSSEATYAAGQPGIAAAVFGGPTVNILSFEGGAIGAADTTPPLRSNGQPTGSLPGGATQTTLSLTTNENATCRYATAAGVAYGSMPLTFATTGGTAHATAVTGLAAGGNYNYYVRCRDAAANANPDDFTISFTVAQAADATPPVRANGQPTGMLAAGTTQATLSLTTNENATCRYAAAAGVAYGSMTNTFANTGATAHATTVTGLAAGGSYNYYVRCQDAAGNANPDDFLIAFSVAAGGAAVTSSFAGIESPLSEGGMWDSPGTATDLRKNNGAYSVDSWGHARLVTPALAADQYSEITYSQDPGSSSWVGVTTRIQGAANGSCYLAIAYGGGVRLYRVENSGSLSFAQLAAASADISAAPRRLRLESRGGTHRVYLNGAQLLSANDATYAAGQPGIAAAVFGGPTVNILTFEGGAITAP